MGSFYGALPAHDGLWDSALETSSDLLAWLAVEHCIHEVCIIMFHFLFLVPLISRVLLDIILFPVLHFKTCVGF